MLRTASDVDDFIHAVHRGDLRTAKRVVEKHFLKGEALDYVHPLFRPRISRPLLFYAVSIHQKWLADWLLLKGANVDVQCQMMGFTCLMSAVDRDAYEMAELLLNWGANVHIRNYSGQTAFMLCQSLSMAQLLLRYGANINDRCFANKTNLFLTIHERQKRMSPEVFARYIIFMFRHGADPFFKTKDGPENGKSAYDLLEQAHQFNLLAAYRSF